MATVNGLLPRNDQRVLWRAALGASGLQRMRIGTGRRIAVLTCDCHDEDREVAVRAINLSANCPLVLDVTLPLGELTERLTELRSGVLFACEEGTQRWRATNVPMRVIGDGIETTWWKAFEAREIGTSEPAWATSATA